MSAVPSQLPAAHAMRVAGAQLAFRIMIGAGIAWLLVRNIAHHDPLWAMISVVIVSDVELDATLVAFRSRALNTIIGCAVGLAFLYAFGAASWSILLGMSAAVLISTHFVQTLTAWRIAPVTVALVMMPGVLQGSAHAGTPVAIMRVIGVLTGSAVAVFVSWAFFLIARVRRRSSTPLQPSS